MERVEKLPARRAGLRSSVACLVCVVFLTTGGGVCRAASWVSPTPGQSVANVVDVAVNTAPPQGVMCTGVHFYAKEQAQGGHPAPPNWHDLGFGSPDPSNGAIYHVGWFVANYPHTGAHDLKAVISYMRYGMPPQVWSVELTTTATVANALVSCTSQQQATPDPGVLKYDPDDPAFSAPQIDWSVTGAFAPDTINYLVVTIFTRGGQYIRKWEISPPVMSGTVTWDGKSQMGVAMPKGFYAFGIGIIRFAEDTHQNRQSDVSVSSDGQDPLVQRWEKPSVGSVKFRFDYTVTDGLHLGADTLTATLCDPDLDQVDAHNLPPGEGTWEAYSTYSGLPLEKDGDWRFALTYNEQTTGHSQWNKDHIADFGYPLFTSFHVEDAVNWDYSGGGQQAGGTAPDATTAAEHQRDQMVGRYWYAAKVFTDADAATLRAAVNRHPSALFFHAGHGDGGDPGLIQTSGYEWVICGYDASPEHNQYYHPADQQPQPIASVSHPEYQWDLSECKLFMTYACHSSEVGFHGSLPQAAVSRGAQTAVGFHDHTNFIGTPWTLWIWGSLCIGKEHFGFDPTGPLAVGPALQFAEDRMTWMYGDPWGSNNYDIAGDPYLCIVP